MRRTLRALMAAAALLVVALSPAAAQQRVVVTGRGDPILDDLVRRVIADPSTLLLTRDTLIARGDTLTGQIAAVGITMRIEGVVDASLLIVDANVFVRPFGVVRGSVTNVAGGFWPSEYAVVEAEVNDRGDAPYDVERFDGGMRIVGSLAARSSIRTASAASGRRPTIASPA